MTRAEGGYTAFVPPPLPPDVLLVRPVSNQADASCPSRCSWPGRPSPGVLDSITLVDVSTQTFEQAGRLDPAPMWTLDAGHLAGALEPGDDLEGIVTYDDRMAEAFAGVFRRGAALGDAHKLLPSAMRVRGTSRAPQAGPERRSADRARPGLTRNYRSHHHGNESRAGAGQGRSQLVGISTDLSEQ